MHLKRFIVIGAIACSALQACGGNAPVVLNVPATVSVSVDPTMPPFPVIPTGQVASASTPTPAADFTRAQILQILATTPRETNARDPRGTTRISASFQGANLQGVDLRGLYFVGANMAKTNLSGANLSDADLRFANLSQSNLGGAILNGANLTSANLTNANLTGANLSGTVLNSANLAGATMPTGVKYDPAKHDRAYGIR